MAKPELQFIVEGKDAETAAAELAGLIQDAFAIEATPRPIREKAPGPDKKMAPSPLDVAALMVALPAAVLTVMDIVERLKKKKQVDAFKKNTDALSLRYKSTRISIRQPDGVTVLIETMESNDLMDLASGDQR